MFPCIQTIQRLPLNTMTLEVKTNRVYTAQGVPLTVIGTAQVKINGANETMLTYAAEQFGGEKTASVHSLVRTVQVRTSLRLWTSAWPPWRVTRGRSWAT